jgi:CRISPR-associated protein Csx17
MPNQITLRGCAPDTLIHYLKALGVLRLVAEQLDANVRGAWRGDSFVLATDRTPDELLNFFLSDYHPTPIVAPWNGGSGFYPQDKNQRTMINSLCRADATRFDEYRAVVAAARLVVGERKEQPKEEEKAALLRHSRRQFPEAALSWLDAAFVLGEDKVDYMPLLGSGGNDGRLDFTINFIARLLSALPETIKQETFQPLDEATQLDANKCDKLKQKLERQYEKRMAQSREQLHAALFLDRVVALESAAVGQFHPAGAGGANATQGVSGGSFVNAWDFILAIEGTLMLASAAVRQLAAGARSRASFPFTAINSAVGYGTATTSEKTRAEMWLPLWSRFTSYGEVSHIFREGRVQFNQKQSRRARTGFDFARAVAELGVDRGIDAFQRYAFIERNGQANLAAPLGRFAVRERPRAGLIHEIDHWLDSLRRATSDAKRTPPRFSRARAQVEQAIFDLCVSGEREDLRATLIKLGEAEGEIARGQRFREEHGLRPVVGSFGRGLSERWARECDDGTPEFELAAALASITGEGKRGVFRASLEPVEVRGGSVNWTPDDAGAVWGAGALEDNLAAVLQRRSIDARSGGLSHPLMEGRRVASLRAVDLFLRGDTDDERIEDERLEELLRGLALIDWRNDAASGGKRMDNSVPPALPRAYALLKLLFLPEGKLWRARQAEPVEIRHEPSIIPLLRARRAADALEVAQRRLRSSGLVAFTDQLHFHDEDGARLAAALLIPISERAATSLAETVLRPAAREL